MNNLFVFQTNKNSQRFQNLFLNLIYNVFTEQCLLSPYIESSYVSNRSTILNLEQEHGAKKWNVQTVQQPTH